MQQLSQNSQWVLPKKFIDVKPCDKHLRKLYAYTPQTVVWCHSKCDGFDLIWNMCNEQR